MESTVQGSGIFLSLGRRINRHPWYPIVAWIVLLGLGVTLLGHVSAIVRNSATTLPSSSTSAQASDEVARLFPNSNTVSSSIILVQGPNVTGPAGLAVLRGLDSAVRSDRSLFEIVTVSSLPSAYSNYLSGQGLVAAAIIRGSFQSSPALGASLNASSYLAWGPASLFLDNWYRLAAAGPGTDPRIYNYPAYNQTRSDLAGSAVDLTVLNLFYSGTNGSGGFNGSANCAAAPNGTIPTCSEVQVRLQERAFLLSIVSPSSSAVVNATLDDLGLGNFTAATSEEFAASTLLVAEASQPAPFLATVWNVAYPLAVPNGTMPAAWPPSSAHLWANSTVANGTPETWPLPLPATISARLIGANGSASIIVVGYGVESSYVNRSGGAPVFSDVQRINELIRAVKAQFDPSGSYRIEQTGTAALDLQETTDLNADLAIVLPLTLVVLFAITVLYFRSPLAPLLTFGSLGVALGLGTASVVVVGLTITKVDPTALTLVSTFVLGVGTDYAIFLVARYREELAHGANPNDAVVTSVAWAGQSIATSGATAILATLALAFSGVALLSQWGIVLSIAITITLLVALTLVPAVLTLLGPRVFWPYTGERGARQALAVRDREQREATYFFRAGRRSQRRPRAITAIILVVSVPLVYVALSSSLSFDFYLQVPRGQPATDGLAHLGETFGPGFAFPTQVLVTFRQPLATANSTGLSSVSPTEFTELADIASLISSTHGVASVGSPMGAGSPPLGTWLNVSQASVGQRLQLAGMLAPYLGNDGVTVLLRVVTTSSGLSAAAVGTLQSIESKMASYQTAHSEVASFSYGGGASITHDLQSQTAVATERMVLAVSIGLIAVLLAVLRSWLIPLLAVGTIGLSIGWAWGITVLVLGDAFSVPLFFYVPTVLFILILGLGIDYNIFLLTRVREERLKGRTTGDAMVYAVAATGGIITAAAVILASAFGVLVVGNFLLLRAIGFSVAAAILLDAMVVRTYLVPSALAQLGERVWRLWPRRPRDGRPET